MTENRFIVCGLALLVVCLMVATCGRRANAEPRGEIELPNLVEGDTASGWVVVFASFPEPGVRTEYVRFRTNGSASNWISPCIPAEPITTLQSVAPGYLVEHREGLIAGCPQWSPGEFPSCSYALLYRPWTGRANSSSDLYHEQVDGVAFADPLCVGPRSRAGDEVLILTHVVPEPSVALAMVCGVAGLVVLRRRWH